MMLSYLFTFLLKSSFMNFSHSAFASSILSRRTKLASATALFCQPPTACTLPLPLPDPLPDWLRPASASCALLEAEPPSLPYHVLDGYGSDLSQAWWPQELEPQPSSYLSLCWDQHQSLFQYSCPQSASLSFSSDQRSYALS